jgi:hypothetical protein
MDAGFPERNVPDGCSDRKAEAGAGPRLTRDREGGRERETWEQRVETRREAGDG